MRHSLKQVVQLKLHDRYLLFERSEAAGQMAAISVRIHAFQNLGTGKVGEIPSPRPVASFLQRAILFLAKPEHHDPVSRLTRHRQTPESSGGRASAGHPLGRDSQPRLKPEAFAWLVRYTCALGTGKVGEIPSPRPVASFLQRAILFLAKPEHHDPVSRLTRHRI